MTPDLLLHPVSNEAEALTGVPDGEIVHPPSQDRIDQLNHPIHRLGLESPEHFLELAQQRRTFLQFRRVMRSPHLPVDAAQAAEIKPLRRLALSAVGMLLATLGYLPPIAGAIGQEAIDLLAVLKSLRASIPGKVLQDF